MSEYQFEGRVLKNDLSEDVLNRLASLVISYKLLSKDRITKAAKAQEAFIRGYLYGLEAGLVIDSTESTELYKFFMTDV